VEVGPFDARVDRPQRLWVGIRRLPFDPAQCAREMNRMLAGPARDLEYPAGSRKHAPQLRQNRFRVAFGGWAVSEAVALGGS
jgi:hypothetical protein